MSKSKFIGYSHRIEIIDREGNWYQIGFPFKATKRNLTLWIDSYNQAILNKKYKNLDDGALIASAKLVSMKDPYKKKTVLEATIKYNN